MTRLLPVSSGHFGVKSPMAYPVWRHFKSRLFQALVQTSFHPTVSQCVCLQSHSMLLYRSICWLISPLVSRLMSAINLPFKLFQMSSHPSIYSVSISASVRPSVHPFVRSFRPSVRRFLPSIRPTVCPSVRLSVRPSVDLRYIHLRRRLNDPLSRYEEK